MSNAGDAVEFLDHLAAKPARRRFSLMRACEVGIEPPRWLIRGYLEADTVACLFGDPACGKSFLAVDAACCVATGSEFHGHKVKHGPVIYLAGEGRNGLARRLRAWSIRHQEDLDDVPLYLSNGPAALCDGESAMEVLAAVNSLAEAEGSPALIVIDTLARNFGGGDENSTQDMGKVIQVLDAMRTQHQATLLLVHHTGHADKSRGRGSMALKGALDAEYRMERDEMGITRLIATKMKDAAEPDPLAFKLRAVELPMLDEDGNAVTSAVLDQVGYTAPPRKGSAGRGKNQTAAVGALRQLCAHHRGNLESAGLEPDGARVALEEWRDACQESGIDRRRFPEVLRSLKQQGVVTVEGGYAYLNNAA